MGKLTRRAFIASGLLAGGGLALAIAVRPGNRKEDLAKLVQGEGELLVNAYLKILPDNSIKIIIVHAEMGQGVQTSLAMMLADELDADWNTVSVERAPAHEDYSNYHMIRSFMFPHNIPEILEDTANGLALRKSKKTGVQITAASMSIRVTGERAMRMYGAAARELFVQAAADEWGVPENEIVVRNSFVEHSASNNRQPFVAFAEQVASQTSPVKPKLKDRADFTLMGKNVERVDIPQKVDGRAVFGVDVELPNMKYATVQAAPVFGSSIVSYDAGQAEAMAGVVKVVNLDNAIGVIADSYWTAKKALQLIAVEYSTGDNDKASTESIFAMQAKKLDQSLESGQTSLDYETGDTKKALEQSDSVYEAEYRVPVLAHATMEPMSCAAFVAPDGDHKKIELWGGFQNPLRLRNHIVSEFGFDDDKVKVNPVFLGGGFGRRIMLDYPSQAARLAMAVPGTPVKTIWSREEDIQQDYYRTQSIGRFKAGVDENKQPYAWETLYVDKADPYEASRVNYDIPNQYVHYVTAPSHVPSGAWRSVGHTQHIFMIESFVDELAYQTQQDPYEFRAKLLSGHPRTLGVLQRVANMANWKSKLPAGFGRGIAARMSYGTAVAQVVEVEILNGKPKVHKVYCCADPGFAIHPDGFSAQMESGIVYGLTAALYGEIKIENGAVKQSNFHDYQMLRMDEAPEIQIEVFNSGARPGGGGEPGTPPIFAALTNAIFAASGKRIRELPVSKYDNTYS